MSIPSLQLLVEKAAAALNAGRFDAAVASADAALAIAPGSFEALLVKTLALLNAGNARAALPHAQRLAAHFAGNALAHNSLGAVHEALRQLPQATEAYRAAVQVAPAFGDGWANLGRMLVVARQNAEAARCFEEAKRHGSQHPQLGILLNISLAYAALQSGTYDAALHHAREALKLAPGYREAQAVAALAELHAGDSRRSLDAYRQLEATAPDPQRWQLVRAIAWPAIMESRERIAERFEETNRLLDRLVASPAPIGDPLSDVSMTGFYIAYQGFDDTRIQGQAAKALALACPSLTWTAAHVGRPRPPGRRIRIGILSYYLRNHTIGKLNIGIARKLDRKRFELVVLRPGTPPDALARAYDETADAVVTLPRDLQAAREKAAEAQLDALFFPDIGMDAFTYYLAFARLAKVQFTTWGHPVTPGIANIDYFLSTPHAEPQDAQRFYHEELVMIDDLLPRVYSDQPLAPSALDFRARLGLAPGTRLYVCPQTLYKFHPDFDAAMLDILRRDRDGRLVLIAANAAWNQRLLRRLQQADADAAARVVFHPSLPLPDFLALMKQADALLDTFHFGGGSSSYEAFSLGVPVVTLPGAMLRGRLTLGWYRMMGVSRWIARSPEHFAELALELAHGDAAQRRQWSDEIVAGAARIVDDERMLRQLEAFVESALARAQA
jgi:protein O-GlcNAc transferase